MKTKIKNKLESINLFLSKNAQSRPSYQVSLIVDFLLNGNRNMKFGKLLDIGGGFDAPYKKILKRLSEEYVNMEIKRGSGVDVVGTVYEIPFDSKIFDVVCLFMVMEHLNEPFEALKECNRVLKRKGYLALTTVQYWQTHNYPSDYFRYTKSGLTYLCEKAGFRVIKVYSHGGPFLVLFHVIEINLRGSVRLIYCILFYKLFNFLDNLFFNHYDKRAESDSVGWTVIATK